MIDLQKRVIKLERLPERMDKITDAVLKSGVKITGEMTTFEKKMLELKNTQISREFDRSINEFNQRERHHRKR